MKALRLLIACLIPLFLITMVSAQTANGFSDPYNKHAVKNSVNDGIVVVFNDSHLEQAVRETLAKPSGDIYDTDMETLTSFTAEDDSISDLTGLEYAVNLTKLYLNNNLIVDLTPLQGLTSLTRLELYKNNIVDITPLQNLTNLSNISLIQNQITSLTALQNLVNLQYLYLDRNPITDFTGIQNLPNLLTLMINGIDLSDLSIVQNISSLTALYIERTTISDLSPLQNLNQLKLLFASSNQISDITPLQNIPGLENIKLSYNQISDISPLQNLTGIYQLILSENQITDISATQNMTDLEYLTIRNNQIKDITPVQNLTHLIGLQIDNNKVRDITAVQNLSNLKTLALTNNPIQDISPVANLTELTSFWSANLHLKDVNHLQNLVNLQNLGIDGNLLDHEDLPGLYHLDKLKLLYLNENPGIISGTKMQELADNLPSMNCEDIRWDGTCGADPNAAAICWCEPSDSAEVGQVVTVQATATDNTQKQVQMKIDWGDGTISDYVELNANASTFEFSHAYATEGYFDIRVMAKNESAVETDWSDPHTIIVGEPVVSVETEDNIIREFSLEQNYPNPFNPATTISYALPKSVQVRISIYNMLGQQIKVLEDKIHQEGLHKVQWNGKDENGNLMTSGVYMCHIQAGTCTQTIKLMLIR